MERGEYIEVFPDGLSCKLCKERIAKVMNKKLKKNTKRNIQKWRKEREMQ